MVYPKPETLTTYSCPNFLRKSRTKVRKAERVMDLLPETWYSIA